MKKNLWIALISLFLVGCIATPTPVTVTNVITKEVTQLVTVEVTKLVIVTATYAGPTLTPTITPTPKPTATLVPTVDQSKTDKMDGSYMVGTEITAGIWRSKGGSADSECWLTIKTLSGDLVDITGELPGATIRIPAGQYIVYIGGGSGNRCTWSLLLP